MEESVPSTKLTEHWTEEENAVDTRGLLPENDPIPCLRRNGMPETLVRPSIPKLQIRTDCCRQRPRLASRPVYGSTSYHIRRQPTLPKIPPQTPQPRPDSQRAPGQQVPHSTLNPLSPPNLVSYGYMTQYYGYGVASTGSKQPSSTLQPTFTYIMLPKSTEASCHPAQKNPDPDFDTPIPPSRIFERKKQQRRSGLATEWKADCDDNYQDLKSLSRAEWSNQAIYKRDRLWKWLEGINEDEQTAENAASALMYVGQRFLGTEKLIAQKYRGDGEGVLKKDSRVRSRT